MGELVYHYDVAFVSIFRPHRQSIVQEILDPPDRFGGPRLGADE